MARHVWAIDGDVNNDVKHAASVARVPTWAAFEGEEGIVNPLDFRVQELAVPGTSIRVSSGTGAVLNRATGVMSQTYAIQMTEEEQYPITATDSGGMRSDLVVARVENPYLAGEPPGLPANPEEGPYWHVRIVEGVPAGTIDYYDLTPGTYGAVTVASTDSVITLARIDIPISTGTILQSHIKDLRSMARFGGKRQAETVVERNPWTEASYHAVQNDLLSSHTTYQYWPSQADWMVPVPANATGVDVFINVDAQMRDGGIWGDMVLEIDGSSAGFVPTEFDCNYTGNPMIVSPKVISTYPISASVRGRIVRVRIKARAYSGSVGRLRAKPADVGGGGTYTYASLTFEKKPSFV